VKRFELENSTALVRAHLMGFLMGLKAASRFAGIFSNTDVARGIICGTGSLQAFAAAMVVRLKRIVSP